MPNIHPTAIVDSRAELGEDVVVGPFSTVGPHVVLGRGVTLVSHVVIDGRTTIGEGTRVFPFASLGQPPQDLKYKGEPSRLEIGAHNVIREHVTMNPGTEGGAMLTRVGNHGLFMIGAHIAHDCVVGDRVVIANNVLMAGHVEIADGAVIGGGAAIHQHTRVGKLAMIGGHSAVGADILPFTTAISGGKGRNGQLVGLNIVGLRRAGFSRDDIAIVREAYRILFSEDAVADQKAVLAARWPGHPLVGEMISFMDHTSSRGLLRPGPDSDE